MSTKPKLTDKQKIARLRSCLETALRMCEGCTGWAHDDEPAYNRRNQLMLDRWRRAIEDSKD